MTRPSKERLFWQALVLRKECFGILVINLFEDVIGQLHSVDEPPTLSWVSPRFEIVVASFEPTKLIPVKFFLNCVIRAEHDAIRILQEKFS